ncbi:O-antigen ligase family protein [Thalassotalea euphylliae]|uniref:O-antigen ligase-related domain-containing protein n=1 Tax=Thalassotalea euphylliae TaxID=1655234 RepID=A0A3E0UI44_9GAMM|nr:O-antigen ligase family protein [Thalassotalea euphylliae]REL36559.1 hypothetical protein DXX92_15240 [Thalassotalea euphylliae]
MNKYEEVKTTYWNLRFLDKLLIILLLVVIWGPPFPLQKAVEVNEFARSAGASLAGSLNTKAYFQIAAWFIFAIVLFFSILTKKAGYLRDVIKQSMTVKLWFSLLFCCVISQLFSVGFLLSGFRLFQFFVLLMFALYMLASGRAFINSTLYLVGSYIAINFLYNIIMFVVIPDAVVLTSYIGFERLVGGWFFRRDYGLCALLVLFYGAAKFFSNGYSLSNILICLFALIGLYLGGTRALMIAAIISIAFVWIATRRNLNVKIIAKVVVLFLFLIIAIFLPEINETMGRSAKSLATGSGRFEAWNLFISDFFSGINVVFGGGFLVGGKKIALTYYQGAFGNMHNMYLEVLVDLGLIGFTVFMLMVGVNLYNIIKILNMSSFVTHYDYRNLIIAILIFISVLVFGVTSNAFMEDFTVNTFIFLLSSFYISCFSRYYCLER